MSVKSALTREFNYLSRKAKIHPADFPNHAMRSWRLFQAQRQLTAESQRNASKPGYMAHFGVHLTGDNAGDVVLYDAVQRLFLKFVDEGRFRTLALREPVEQNLINELNRDARCIVIGGGGLIFPIEASRSRSGWQWNILQSTLETVSIPLILFAIGVNNFRGQQGFGPEALKHLATTCQKSSFIGLRNNGSIQKLQSMLPDLDRSKVFWQPCPTTVINYFTEFPKVAPQNRATIAVNTAVDQAELRFQGRAHEVLDSVADACGRLAAAGHNVIVVTHAEKDDSVLPFLKRRKAKHTVKRLERCLASEVTDFYAGVDLTLGMRGHAQMIPFGCGNAIVSIKSHDKLGFFLDDIGHPEWGIEALEPDLATRLVALSESIVRDLPTVRQKIAVARQKLWDLTSQNMERIAASLSKA
jgi:polysaccharide pyruvyl transferase WcaK-like protein